MDAGGKGHVKSECPSSKRLCESDKTMNRGRGYRGNSTGRGNSRGCGRSDHARVSEDSKVVHYSVGEEKEFDFIAAGDNVDSALYSESHQSNCNIINFVLDTGATNHWVSEKVERFMQNVENVDEAMEIKIVNGDIMKGTKRGTLCLKVLNNKGDSYAIISIPAIIVPGSSCNLLSVKRMSAKGYDIMFNSGRNLVTITNDELQMQCKSVGNLYVANFYIPQSNVNEICCITSSKDTLWHQRLGHLNAQSLRQLNFPCNFGVCNQGKAKRKPFENVDLSRSNKIGGLIHSDLAGPFKVHTINMRGTIKPSPMTARILLLFIYLKLKMRQKRTL